ncbi:MAG: TolC family protein [Bacteroidota bacterium]|nr:TolC family protein [Bacteroidota bacterium]
MKKEVKIFSMMIFLLMLGLLVNTPVFSQVKTLTFEQALEMSLKNSHIIKQSDYLQKEREQEVKAAKGLYFPKIGITAEYVNMSDDIHLDLSPVRDAITPLYSTLSKYGNFSITGVPDAMATPMIRKGLLQGLQSVNSAEWDQTIQKKQFGTVAATFEWPLYTGGKIKAANKAAKIQLGEAKENTRQKQGELMSELVERYYGLCLAKQVEKVRLDVYNGMEKHLHDALKMEKEGLIANADVLNVRVHRSEAERELSKSHRTADILNKALLNTLAIDDSTSIQPVSLQFYMDSIEPVDYFMNLATKNSPLLAQIESKKELTQQGYKVEKSNYFPTVGVMGAYNIADKDLSPYMPDWMVSVGLKWTVFDGISRTRKVKSASLKTEQVKEYQEKAKSDIETMIDKLYHELNMYKEQLSELDTARSYSQEYLRVREKSFHEEMTNSTDVVDARLALSKILIERLNVIYNYDLTLAHLLEYAGVPEKFTEYQKRKGVKTENY